jgi:tetratricopeptide (TPR) repeat protein
MKHLLPLFLALSLFGAVLWAQSAADSTVYVQLDTLVDREDFPAAATLISATRDASTRNDHWAYFSEKVEAQAERYYESEAFDKAVAVLDSALVVLNKAGRADALATAYLYSWKAATYRKLEQYAGALEAYNEAIRIYERRHYNGDELAFCYKNAAQVYIRRQDYRQADKYLLTAINSDSTKLYLQSIYGQLANNAYWQDSLDKALRFF